MAMTTDAARETVMVIHRHASPGVGSVNTWWIETDSGIVLVDAQRQISQAVEVSCNATKRSSM